MCDMQVCAARSQTQSSAVKRSRAQWCSPCAPFSLKGIDVRSMGRIFVGLVKCGAWGCFDEFNRLEEAVLSAVSMQIQAIQNSLKNQRNCCELLAKEVSAETAPQSCTYTTI